MNARATTIDDLTDAEISGLTDAEVDMLIKRRMAEEGIPIWPLPIEPDYEPARGPDLSVYEIAGLAFADRESAEDVLTVINRHADSRVKTTYTGSDWDTRYVQSDDSPQSVTTRMYFSAETYAAQKTVLETNAERKRSYETEQREYRDAERKAQSIRDEIHGRINEVRAKAARVTTLADRFVEYRAIAQGDDLMAMQFLLKAFDMDDDEIEAVRRHSLVVPVDEQRTVGGAA